VGYNGSPFSAIVPVAAQVHAGVWHTQSLTVSGSSNARFNGVACSDAAHCVAVGQAYAGNTRGITPIVGESNGSTWHVGTAPVPQVMNSSELTGVSCVGTGDCWAVGSAGTYGTSSNPSSQQAAVEHWDGTQWTYGLGPAIPAGDYGNELDGVACVAGGQCMAVGEDNPSSSGEGGAPMGFVYR
jgi:hypothetical protein